MSNLASEPVKVQKSEGICSETSISEPEEIEYIRFDSGFYITPNKCALIVQNWSRITKPNDLIYLPDVLTPFLLRFVGLYILNA